SATTAIGKGGTDAAVPMNDIGFNPKCIVKKAPTAIGMMATGSWWQYSIDYDYIKSIGGVAKCFSPATRSGTPDIGAYKNGMVTANPVVACVPTIPPDHAGPPMPAAGGSGGASTTDVGGATAAGGASSAQGGTSASGAGTPGTALAGNGSVVGSGGAGVGTAGGSPVGGPGNPAATAASTDAGCGCRVASQPTRSSLLIGLGSFGLALLSLRRRRARVSQR
ncbi:MAG TPA: MYXO-CTERM sorting domain-containing protein, partial [Polyangiaceae bacterium]